MSENTNSGRSQRGKIYVHEDKIHPREVLERKSHMGDDDAYYNTMDGNKFFFLYECPRPDDNGQGHLSVWVRITDEVYKNVFALSGDDDMVYNRFHSHHSEDSLPNSVDMERVEKITK